MNKQISSKTVSLVFAILVVCFVIGFYVLAWTEPTQAPPGGNVPAPLNVSGTGQEKVGGLIIHSSSSFEDPANPNALLIPYGNVGIGTTSPTTKLEVIGADGSGGIRVQGTVFDSSKRSANFDYELADDTVRIYGVGPNVSTRPSLKILMAGLNYNNPITPFFINPTGNVGIGTTNPSSGTGGQLKLDVEGPVGATKYCDENGNNCKTINEIGGGGGYRPLVAGSDDTGEAEITITSSGITFQTDNAVFGQQVNPVFFDWPVSGINEIIFEVENLTDGYCVGGDGALGLSGGGTDAKCTRFYYTGSTLTKLSMPPRDTWIRLSINGNQFNNCPDELGRTPNSGYPGTYASGTGETGISLCKYSKTAGHWSGEITEIKIEEYDHSVDNAVWHWKIWYK